ncbi:MAG: NUDIX domain-containing protein, partial [Bacteroidota bacterium]
GPTRANPHRMNASPTVNPNVSVDCVVFGFDMEEMMILLIEQKNLPEGNPQYALPGDLVRNDENLDEAAARVLLELTSLEGIYLKQFRTFGDPDRVKDVKDRDWLSVYRDNPDARVITVGYYSLVKMDDFEPSAASFAGKAVWQKLSSVPALAFDHNMILTEAVNRLREEFTHKHLGFELLPEKFTLTQLQRLYEIILNKKLDKRNFRKKLKKMDQVVALNEKQQGVLHKPAQLYKFNE